MTIEGSADVDAVNAYDAADGEHVILAVRSGGDWHHLSLTVADADQVHGMLYLLTKDRIARQQAPPCPRCGEPMSKVQIASLSDAPDSDKFAWGHDCEPETFSDMAPGWRL